MAATMPRHVEAREGGWRREAVTHCKRGRLGRAALGMLVLVTWMDTLMEGWLIDVVDGKDSDADYRYSVCP